MPQSAFLFDDTVRGNVTLGADVPDEEVWAALRTPRPTASSPGSATGWTADSASAARPSPVDSVNASRWPGR